MVNLFFLAAIRSHLYHGYLGAKAFLERGTTCCFDPNFQAGYPKTPIFDAVAGRPELFLLGRGGSVSARGLQNGLAACSLLAPCLVRNAGLALGLRLFTAALAGWLGMGVWWSGPCQGAFQAGDLEILLVGLGLMSQFAFLIRFASRAEIECLVWRATGHGLEIGLPSAHLAA